MGGTSLCYSIKGTSLSAEERGPLLVVDEEPASSKQSTVPSMGDTVPAIAAHVPLLCAKQPFGGNQTDFTCSARPSIRCSVVAVRPKIVV